METLNEKDLKKLRKMLAVLDEDTLTRAEFISAFGQVLKLVQKIEKRNSDQLAMMSETYKLMASKAEAHYGSNYSELKEKVMEYCKSMMDKMMDKQESKLDEMTKEMSAMHSKMQGKMEEVVTKIETMENEEDPEIEMDKPEQLRDKLETLKGKERLRISAIDGLEEKLNEVSEKASKSSGYVPGGAKGRVHYYDLTSQCNGSNKAFVIPFNFGVIGLFSTQAPVNYRPMIDWTLADKTLTLTDQVNAPAIGQTLWVMYIR